MPDHPPQEGNVHRQLRNVPIETYDRFRLMAKARDITQAELLERLFAMWDYCAEYAPDALQHADLEPVSA